MSRHETQAGLRSRLNWVKHVGQPSFRFSMQPISTHSADCSRCGLNAR